MPSSAVGPLVLFLSILLAAAHLLGYLFAKLRQPRVIGEILAGIVLGPFVLGRWSSYASLLQLNVASSEKKAALDLIYWMGLLLLMFLSGAETKSLFQKHERKQITWLAIAGTCLPFFAMLAVGSILPLAWFMGSKGSRGSLLLVMSIAVAVTSIPVISRIFFDLKILHTRFARLVLGVAVLEDIGLWAVLAIATALAASSSLPEKKIVAHVAVTILYFLIGLAPAPRIFKRVSKSRFNVLAINSPVTYTLLIVFTYIAIAGLMDVNLVFAAFLAGFAVSRKRLGEALEAISHFSFAFFIPLYFALVGYSLVFGKAFSVLMLLVFLAGACLLKLASVVMGARLAGFHGLDVVNLAIATNARGGPGIILASVAFEAGIISPAFYTTLVLVAVMTSQAAGAWLEFVIRKGWPLLSAESGNTTYLVPKEVPDTSSGLKA
ncbi:MAG TPA: cation:proton antiporter [Candidatus Angelobacter sp.]|jgi:Kef-type K+ transport system membrane component KefB|nr:cation:proton antiporter [Candidatus Angelobacter sp.]